MSGIGLALRQVRYENRAFWRNPGAAFFTFTFPLLFMVIFNVLFGGLPGVGDAPGTRAADFFTPAISVFAVVTATFTNLAMRVSIARDDGLLKRVRGTPLPTWAWLFGRVAHAVLIAFLLVALITAFGGLAYGVEFPWDRLGWLILTLVIGAAVFCVLGLAMTVLIPNADAAPAMVNAVILPLFFISNVFIRMDTAPDWIDALSRVFPVRHFADSMLAIWGTHPGSVPDLMALAVMGAWGLAGLVVTLFRFRWEPRR
jgi:ABC-2 type transport system permease protein